MVKRTKVTYKDKQGKVSFLKGKHDVWVNGGKRIIEKDRYGMYHIFLDDKDVKWLNKLHKQIIINSENRIY